MNTRFDLIARVANDVIWDCDLVSGILYVSPRWQELFGDDVAVPETRQAWLDRVHPDDRMHFKMAWDEYVKSDSGKLLNEHRLQAADGSYRWVFCRGLIGHDEDGNPVRIAGSITDIHDARQAEEKHHHDVLHDTVTELPNRTLLLEHLRSGIARTSDVARPSFALMLLDFDRFKVVNESLGRAVGDSMLRAIAERMESCVDRGDFVAHLGGDEFAIVLEGIDEIGEAIRLAERIQETVMEPFELVGHKVFTSASIGITTLDREHESPEDMMREADTAMHRAEAAGKARHVVFNRDMHLGAIKRLEIENELRRAVEQGAFQVFYQPIIDMSCGRIRSAEALIRWFHAEKGMISPGVFIPVAEETGLISPIGLWVMQTVAEQVSAWKNDELTWTLKDQLSVSVNVSSKQFVEEDLVDRIEESLSRINLGTRHVRLEITESVLMTNPESTTRKLNELKELGFQLYLDDFGTGYSSLNYLHQFPLDVIKIDRSFVNSMEENEQNAVIIRSVLDLAHNLNMRVVAEGIETVSQLKLLRDWGCDYAQGFFFSKPLGATDLFSLLRDDPVW